MNKYPAVYDGEISDSVDESKAAWLQSDKRLWTMNQHESVRKCPLFQCVIQVISTLATHETLYQEQVTRQVFSGYPYSIQVNIRTARQNKLCSLLSSLSPFHKTKLKPEWHKHFKNSSNTLKKQSSNKWQVSHWIRKPLSFEIFISNANMVVAQFLG